MDRDAVESWLYRRLRTIPGLRPLGDKIYPLLSPPGTTLPFAIYLRKDTVYTNTLDDPLPYEVASFVITLFARTYTESKALSRALSDATNGFVGFYAGSHILYVVVTSVSDTLVSSDGGELVPYYGIEITLEIKHRTA